MTYHEKMNIINVTTYGNATSVFVRKDRMVVELAGRSNEWLKLLIKAYLILQFNIARKRCLNIYLKLFSTVK